MSITTKQFTAPTAPRPWYRKKRYAIPLGFLALVVIGNALGGDEPRSISQPEAGVAPPAVTQQAPAQAQPEPAPAQPAPVAPVVAAGIGQPVQDGKFEFVVQGVECGATSVGSQYFDEQAQGQFCLVNLAVKNVGTEPQHMFTDNQYLFDEAGRKFGADSAATFAHDTDTQVWISEINPGNAVDGVLVFDVPADANLVRAELHDSAFSGGVEVNLK